MKKVVFVIAQSNFRDEELAIPRMLLAKNGIECMIASKHAGSSKGMLGDIVDAQVSIDEIDDSFDALIFIGGSGASQYFDDGKALSLARLYFGENKIVAAICIAPSILANSGILKGKKAASFASEKENLKSKGAIVSNKAVEVSGKIVTASGPIAAKAFGEEILALLKSS
jgi:protease I